jgi:hypothetical protein
MTTPTDTPSRTNRCPCGFRAEPWSDQAVHRQRHRQWEHGVRLPKACGAPAAQDLLIIPHGDRAPRWRLAHQLALVARRDGHYDFASFCAPHPHGACDDHDARAFVLVQGPVAVGYAVVRPRRYHTGDGWPATPRPCVDQVWVAAAARRQGIATRLLWAVTEHYAMGHPQALVYAGPFTTAGLALVRCVTKGKVLVG